MYTQIIRKSKPIIIDNLEFPSIVAAAKTLQVSTLDLNQALKVGVFRGKLCKYKNAWDVPQTASYYKAGDYKEILHLQPKAEKQESTKTNAAMMAAFEQANITTNPNKKENKMTKHTTPVLIDGTKFNTLTAAAKYLEVNPIVLHNALKENRDIKGFKVNYEDPNYTPRNRKQPVSLTDPMTGKEYSFESCSAASKFLKVDPTAVTGALAEGRSRVKGYWLKKLDNFIAGNKPKAKRAATTLTDTRQGVSVVGSNGTQYKSIKQLAVYLNIPNWKLVAELRNHGKYIKDGIIYKAEVDAKNRNRSVYVNEVEEQPTPTPVQQIQPVQAPVMDRNKIACDVLKEKAAQLILKDNFTDAKSLLEVIETLK